MILLLSKMSAEEKVSGVLIIHSQRSEGAEREEDNNEK